MSVAIRLACTNDVDAFDAIERSAGELFRDVGMPEIADDEPTSADELADYVHRGHAWVLVGDDDLPIGYALVDLVDDAAHLEQLSVHRDHHGERFGQQLLEHVVDWARSAGLGAVTLTTFRDVPWNAPYYEQCGFRVLTEEELTPGLVEIREHEARDGLDPTIRVCMRRDIL